MCANRSALTNHVFRSIAVHVCTASGTAKKIATTTCSCSATCSVPRPATAKPTSAPLETTESIRSAYAAPSQRACTGRGPPNRHRPRLPSATGPSTLGPSSSQRETRLLPPAQRPSPSTAQAHVTREQPQVDINIGTSARPYTTPSESEARPPHPHRTAPLDPHLHMAPSAVDVEAPASLSCYHLGRHQVVSSPRIPESGRTRAAPLHPRLDTTCASTPPLRYPRPNQVPPAHPRSRQSL
ncbi:hypothetical protein B0H12DRAFT_1073917 [Mycena haematopus]|nr:hypothetical protein B0H12DRAFT_1073917 [Mycena haematopus]